ncbi:MAG: helix-turn-helix transcriptional regulator [Thermohalobaculum sp.]|nr:helix-turn-helix transcriptional regulator [Thermohalobaculum sp.]
MTVTVFDTSAVEPARQFDLFYEKINARILRITPEPGDRPNGFPARILSYGGPARSCHKIETPSHTARRAHHDCRSSDPEQIHLNYMVAGERRVRIGERVFTIRAGDAFALDTRQPFDLLGTDARYCAVKIVFPVLQSRAGSAPRDLTDPQSLHGHRLYGLLCATCGELGAGLERAGALEVSVLASVAEWLFQTIQRHETPATADDERSELFVMVGLEMDRNLDNPEFDLDWLCRSLELSPRCVQRLLERHGTTFSALLREKRMAFAHRRLLDGHCTIEKIAGESGYSGLSAFYRAFRKEFGVPPGAVQRPPRAARQADGRGQD